MSNKIFVEDYLLGAAKGCERNMIIKDDFTDGDAPNVFWYQPNIMTVLGFDWRQLDIVTHMRALDPDDRLISYTQGDDFFIEIDPDTVFNDPDDWKLMVHIKLMDSENKIIIDRIINADKFNHPFPNRAYVCNYTIYRRAHYQGIAVTFPHLDKGKYKFQITEHWTYNSGNSVDKPFSFKRQLLIPVKVTKDIKPYLFDLADPKLRKMKKAWYIAEEGYKWTDRNWFSLIGAVKKDVKRADKPGYTKIGSQSFSLDHNETPRINYDIAFNLAYSAEMASRLIR